MTTIRLGLLKAELSPAGTGINHAVRGVVQTDHGDVEAFVKRLPDHREILVESICALLGRELNLPIPEPLIVFVPEKLGGPQLAFGSIAIEHPNLNAWLQPGQHQQLQQKLRSWAELIPSACFDEWIANCDRHDRNLLFDGLSKFWLIDHGLALNQAIAPDALAPTNGLFDFAVAGQPESELLILKPKTLGVMQSFASQPSQDIAAHVPNGIWLNSVLNAMLAWLEARQNHLMRLGDARIPSRQGDLPYGQG